MNKANSHKLLMKTANSSGENEPLLGRTNYISAHKELLYVLRSSIPVIVAFFLQYSITVTSIFSVGRLGQNELASVSLAAITFNVSVSVFNGMATCLDTFCPQAFGSGNYPLVGLYFKRCSAMILVVSIPILVFWYYSATVLSYVVPEKELLLLAQTYLRCVSIGVPAYILFETGKRFLQAQGIYKAGQYCLIIVFPINILSNYLLVWSEPFGLGYIGGPISAALSYWLMCIFLFAYIIFINGKKCWGEDSFKDVFNFNEWKRMASYAMNGTAMLLSEFIAFEILTLSASKFGTTSLAAQSICSTLATLAFQVPFGVSVALSTRIGYHVGSENMSAVKLMNKVAYSLALTLGVMMSSLLVCFHTRIPRIFINDASVVEVASQIVKILGVNQFFDCPNVILAGSLRGQGRQHIGSVLNLISYYIFAVPVALILAFTFLLKLQGLWIGIGIGIVILSLCELYFIYYSNWDKIVNDSKKRIH